MATTIKDVAKLAMVSPSTVSRVIADSEKISDTTKAKVFEAMKQLKYKPNAIARSLAKKETNILGLIIPNSDENLFRNPFFIEVMRGISIKSQKMGYHIMYAYGDKEEQEIKQLNEFVHSNLVDGVILLTATSNDKCIDFLLEEEFPFVIVGRPEPTENMLWVDNDNFQAMYNVINHLAEKGHKNFGFAGGPLNYNFSKDRYDGFKAAVNVRGLACNEKNIVHGSGFTQQQGYYAASEILKDESISAIVTTDDLIAYGVKQYALENGRDIVVTGFNNINVNQLFAPEIMTVDINAEDLGYHCAKLLIEKLKGKLRNEHYIIKTKIVDRT